MAKKKNHDAKSVSLFRRYIKAIPPKAKQTPQEQINLKMMIDRFRALDKQYNNLHEYGKAIRVQQNKAKLEHKEYKFANHSLKQKFDKTTGSFGMTQPFIE